MAKVEIMDQVYVLMKHTNLVDTDSVEVVCVTKTRKSAYLQMLMEAESFYEEYDVMEQNDVYISFTDADRYALIELVITETRVIDW